MPPLPRMSTCLLKETTDLLSACRRTIFLLLCLYICELWIAIFFFFLFECPWWRRALNILVCSRVRWPSYCYIGVCLSTARPCLFFFLSSSQQWTLLLNRRHRNAMQSTKARLEGEERGQPLTWECHILLTTTINFATLCSSLKTSLAAVLCDFTCVILKGPKN